MSYNISTWKKQKFKGFKIPLELIDEAGGQFYKIGKKGSVFSFHGHGEIEGVEIDNDLEVLEIRLVGEFSGHVYNEIFIENQSNLSGEMSAITVWESGDTIEKVSFKNGVFKEEEIL